MSVESLNVPSVVSRVYVSPPMAVKLNQSKSAGNSMLPVVVEGTATAVDVPGLFASVRFTVRVLVSFRLPSLAVTLKLSTSLLSNPLIAVAFGA